MTTRIFIGSLPYATRDAKLEELFSRYGTVVSAKVITDKLTGRSKGFGFVEMSSSSEAQTAIAALNGSEFDGRSLTVNEAHPQGRQPGFVVDRRGAGGRDSAWRSERAERRRW
jgi:RNA recognition motif-containing protein